jgi:hypothetical protein
MAPLVFGFFASVLEIVALAVLKTPWFLISSLFGAIKTILGLVFITAWDSIILFVNLFTPELKRGTIVKPGQPGYQGIWPKFVEPTDSDSRSPCPYLSESVYTWDAVELLATGNYWHQAQMEARNTKRILFLLYDCV